MQLLDELLELRLIRPVDLHFSRWLKQQHPSVNQSLLALAAIVSRHLGDGHICVRIDSLMGLIAYWPMSVREPLRALLPSDTASMSALVDETVLGTGDELTPLVLNQDRVYLYQYFQYECQVARKLLSLAGEGDVNPEQLTVHLQALFAQSNEQPDWQKVAATTAVAQRVSVISGGPGTGKTTTVTRMLAIYLQSMLEHNPDVHPVIRLAAPTGKAAARLSESIAQAKQQLSVPESVTSLIPDVGVTLHRLLGARPNVHHYQYNADNPLHLDLLVVDEASMIDLPLMASLLEALPEQARLVLIGDKEQLASVEAGSVMGDLCARPAGCVKTPAMQQLLLQTCGVPVEQGMPSTFADAVSLLQRSYRFSANSGIGALARAVNSGDRRAVRQAFAQGYDDIHLLPMQDDHVKPLFQHMQQGYTDYLKAVSEQQAPASVLLAFNRFKVLCGLRRGPWGVEAINQAFELQLEALQRISRKGRWYAGRPVMITRNEPALNLFNGDIGVALPDEATGRLKVWFDLGGELVRFSTSRLPSHETVFAMTVHKSQGSEFDQVTLVLTPTSQGNSRELVYTGITRAKKQCNVWGSIETLEKAACSPTIRMSGLAARLWNGSGPTASIEPTP